MARFWRKRVFAAWANFVRCLSRHLGAVLCEASSFDLPLFRRRGRLPQSRIRLLRLFAKTLQALLGEALPKLRSSHRSVLRTARRVPLPTSKVNIGSSQQPKMNSAPSRHPPQAPTRSGSGGLNNSDLLKRDEERIKQLADKSSQTLLFLSFALVVVATLKDKAGAGHQFALQKAMRCWAVALFPVVLGVLPLKEFRLENHGWYRFVRWMKVFLLWAAIIPILVGAFYFVRAVSAEFEVNQIAPIEAVYPE